MLQVSSIQLIRSSLILFIIKKSLNKKLINTNGNKNKTNQMMDKMKTINIRVGAIADKYEMLTVVIVTTWKTECYTNKSGWLAEQLNEKSKPP